MEQVTVELSRASSLSPRALVRAVDRHASTALRVSIGIVFMWFGVLKFFPSLSPAEPLATETLSALTLGLLPSPIALHLLATFECGIGFCFVTGLFARWALPLLCLHMLGTALPFALFPAQLFVRFPFVPTFEGQYILKNLIILSAALSIRARWLQRA